MNSLVLLTNKFTSMEESKKVAFAFVMIAALGIVVTWIAGYMKNTVLLEASLITSACCAWIGIMLYVFCKLPVRNFD